MKTISKPSFVLGAGLLFSALASADTIWTLDDVTFDYTTIFGQQLNNQATGSFSVGSGLTIDNWDITVTGYQPADGTYDNTDSLAMVLDGGTFILFTNFQGATLLGLDLGSALNSGKTAIDIVPGSILQLDATAACGVGIPPCTYYNTGSIVDAPPSPTPEPTSVALTVPAILGAVMVLRRRKFFAN